MMLETGGQLVVSLTSVIGNVSSTWDLTDFSETMCQRHTVVEQEPL